MTYRFARTFRREPTSQGVGGASVDAFSDRIWRGVGAGEEDEQTDLGRSFMWGAGLGAVVAGAFAFTKWGTIGHLQATLDGMKTKFGVSK
jgi:hypothetical protein